MTDQTLRLSCHSETMSYGSSPDEMLCADGFNLGYSTETPNPQVGCIGQHPTPNLTAELGYCKQGTSENAGLTPEAHYANMRGTSDDDDVRHVTPQSLTPIPQGSNCERQGHSDAKTHTLVFGFVVSLTFN